MLRSGTNLRLWTQCIVHQGLGISFSLLLARREVADICFLFLIREALEFINLFLLNDAFVKKLAAGKPGVMDLNTYKRMSDPDP